MEGGARYAKEPISPVFWGLGERCLWWGTTSFVVSLLYPCDGLAFLCPVFDLAIHAQSIVFIHSLLHHSKRLKVSMHLRTYPRHSLSSIRRKSVIRAKIEGLSEGRVRWLQHGLEPNLARYELLEAMDFSDLAVTWNRGAVD
jgi:hypothetical protein